MSYGNLSYPQQEAMRSYIKGEHVADLGAGDLGYSKHLLRMGAKSVLAIDSAPMRDSGDERIILLNRYFIAVPPHFVRTAFVSWPANRPDQGLLRLVREADVVITLSKNTDGTACGSQAYYRHLISRELYVYKPERYNCLIVVGKRLHRPRKPTGEELAGIRTFNSRQTYWDFEEAEAGAVESNHSVGV